MVNNPWRTIRCRSCGSEYGWNGSYVDMPSCPHCNYSMPESAKEELQRRFDEMLVKASRKTAPRKKIVPDAEDKVAGRKQVRRRKNRRK